MRDFSNARLSIEPADAASWSDVRTAMITEAKSALRAELEMELGAAADEAAVQKLRDEFSRRERAIEHNVDSRPCCFSATVDME